MLEPHNCITFARMKLTADDRLFIQTHAAADVTSLLLKAAQYPLLDVPFLVEQILSRRQVKEKLPAWGVNDQLIFPSKISAEQCSSACTAAYKQRLIGEEDVLCDLTGGLGIDSFYFSHKAKRVIYMERFALYCEAARHNFRELQAANIEVVEADSTACLDQLPPATAFYIDPARRAEGNKRVFALADCEPDLLNIKAALLEKAPLLIAKISPMADIQHTLLLLPETTEVHVLSVKNECKELLFVLRSEAVRNEAVSIHCINFTTQGEEQRFLFTLEQEKRVVLNSAVETSSFIYEPNASILKAGAFKSIAEALNLSKLHPSSHLYTSKEYCPNFPGRSFKVDEVIPFSTKVCSKLARQIPQANITVRNFPLSVELLRKRTKIADGGNVYLFATTRANDEKVLIKCTKQE